MGDGLTMTAFSIQARPRDARSWLQLAQRCEKSGFDALLAADHPGSSASPFVALAAAASVTSTLGLGSYVSNAGIREPVLLASDVATLDVVSHGRARLGLGAGHTPAEWGAVGRVRPRVAGRVRRCIAVAEAVRALLAGEEIEVDTADLVVRSARMTDPLPVQERVPLTFGGANSQLLQWAGRNADIVGLSGFGRTLADGHNHEVRWRPHELEAQLQHVADGAAKREASPALEALVQQVTVTDDAGAAVAAIRRETGMSEDELLAAPFMLIGTQEEIIAAIGENERRWGITRYVVRENAINDVATLMSGLNC